MLKFKNLDEVIKRCNDTKYGLAAGILTNNIDKALKFAQGVRAGSVWVNCYDGQYKLMVKLTLTMTINYLK